jgi:hypothetical protein
MKLTLPKKKSIPSDDLSTYSTLLYGEKKVGKTTLTAEFPNAMLLMCEPGGKGLAAFQRPVKGWLQLKGYLQLLEKGGHDFQTVSIDTIDRAYKMCFDFMCKKMGIEHPQDQNDYGKSLSRITDEFASVVTRFLNLDMGVIFVSHARVEEVKARGGLKFNRVQATLSGSGRGVLEAVVDIWAYYDYRRARRMIQIEGDELIAAGHRLTERFKYTDGTPIRKFPAGTSPAIAYANLVDAFNNRLEKPQPKERRNAVQRKQRIRSKKGS